MSRYDWEDIEWCRKDGDTWPEIAAQYGVTPGTIRKAYSRYRARQDEKEEEAPDRMNILGIDIETAPNTAYVWGLFKQNVSLDQLIQSSRAMCFAARWFSEGSDAETVFFSEHADGHEEMIRQAWELLDEADAVVHYNGSRFDVPVLNREFVSYGLGPPSTYQHIDLLKTARKEFRFSSNKMDHLLKELQIGEKVRHDGFTLWVKCMDGDPEAWERMEEYNRGDVDQLEDLYRRMLPWITNHPNHALYLDTDRPTCTNCGGTNLHKRGTAKTKTQMYQRFQCQDCGTWLRERYTQIGKDKRRHILTQAR